MSAIRGMGAALRAKEAVENRSTGRRNTFNLQLAEDEEIIVRFRGVMFEDFRHIDVDDIKEMDGDELWEALEETDGSRWEDMKKEHMVTNLERRLTAEEEPVIIAQHYNARIKDVITCADPEAAIFGNIHEKTDCLVCQQAMSGDKGISFPSVRQIWTVFDYRRVHAVKDGDNVEYIPCGKNTGSKCRYCRENKAIDERDQDDIPKEELKELVEEEGYHRSFLQGIRVFSLAKKFAPIVHDIAERVYKTCRSCGIGKLKPVYAECPDCGAEFEASEVEELLEEGWKPAFPHECPECEENVKFIVDWECDRGCDDAEPGRLSDAKVRVKKTGDQKTVNWIMSEVLPLEPLDFDDEEDRKVLGARLPDFDKEYSLPSEERQQSFMGLVPKKAGSGKVSDAPQVKTKSRRGSRFKSKA